MWTENSTEKPTLSTKLMTENPVSDTPNIVDRPETETSDRMVVIEINKAPMRLPRKTLPLE